MLFFMIRLNQTFLWLDCSHSVFKRHIVNLLCWSGWDHKWILAKCHFFHHGIVITSVYNWIAFWQYFYMSITEVSAVVKVGDCSTKNYSATTRRNVQCTIKKMFKANRSLNLWNITLYTIMYLPSVNFSERQSAF